MSNGLASGQVHAKVKDVLTKVVDPDTVSYSPPSAAPNAAPMQVYHLHVCTSLLRHDGSLRELLN